MPTSGVTSGILNTATEDCRNKSQEPDCGESQSHLMWSLAFCLQEEQVWGEYLRICGHGSVWSAMFA